MSIVILRLDSSDTADKYYCSECSHEASSVFQLKYHIQRQHKTAYAAKLFNANVEPEQVTCILCDYKIYDQSRLYEHCKQAHCEELDGYLCDHRKYESNSSLVLIKHYGNMEPSDSFEDSFQCYNCSYQTKLKSALTRHMVQHATKTEIEWFQCDHCSYRADQKVTLERHMLQHAANEEMNSLHSNHFSYRANREMADEVSIGSLLEAWGFQELIPAFEKEGIIPEILEELLNSEADTLFLKTLIPQLGRRLLIIKKITAYVKSTQTLSGYEAVPPTTRCLDSIHVGPATHCRNYSCTTDGSAFDVSHNASATASVIDDGDAQFVPKEDVYLEEIVIQSPTPFVNSIEASNVDEASPIPAKKIRLNDHLDNFGSEKVLSFNLAELLQSSLLGQAITNMYALKGTLDSFCQAHLVDIIITHFLDTKSDDNYFRRLKNGDFDILAGHIVKCFPTEVKALYYTPPVRKCNSRDNKAGIARGKLVDKYKNRLTFLRKAQILPSRAATHNESEDSDDDKKRNCVGSASRGEREDILWLKRNVAPWKDVEKKWDATLKSRQALLKSDVPLGDIYDEYIALREPNGLTLIIRDFERLHPQKLTYLYDKWESVVRKLIAIKKKQLNETDQILLDCIKSGTVTKDYLHYLMLILLPALLPCRATRHVLKNKSQWKPTVAETREGIILRAESAADVRSLCNKKEDRIKRLNLPLQPYIVVVAGGVTISKIFVSVNSHVYETETLLAAINTCFACFQVLNLRYPVESEHIWHFIQFAIYDLKTKWDIPNPSIADICNKVNLDI